jgi:hypothetical protein
MTGSLKITLAVMTRASDSLSPITVLDDSNRVHQTISVSNLDESHERLKHELLSEIENFKIKILKSENDFHILKSENEALFRDFQLQKSLLESKDIEILELNNYGKTLVQQVLILF